MTNNTISYGSVCSGIEAASVAWEVLGFSPTWFSQFDPEHKYKNGPDFPSAVLAHHWPEVPNLGDMTKLAAKMHSGEIDAPDILVGGTPCFTAGHMVLTAKGYVPIEDIMVGDMVITHTGELRRVVRTGSKIAHVGVLSGVGICEPITCTRNHPFRSVKFRTQSTRRAGKSVRIEHVESPSWTPAIDMPGLQWCSLLDVNCAPPSFPSSISEDEALYIAGFYLGDGWIRRWSGANKKAVAFGVNKTKLGKFKDRTSIHISITQEKTGPRITLCSTEIAEWLISNFGEYSHEKTMPAWVLSHPLRASLLDGYLDTDGNKMPNGWRSITVSRQLAYGIRDLSQTLGMVSSVSFTEVSPTKVIDGRTVNQRNYWSVTAFERGKSRKSRVHHGMLLRKITAFDEVGEDTVFNIEVEGEHSYILDGVIVHNCQAFSVAGARAGLSDPRGQLTISYGELADAIDDRRAAAGLPPAIIVWENVPGVLSSKDNAFGAFLGLLAGEDCELQPPGKRWENAGYVRGPKRTIAWRILDAQYFRVAQRRRRVFVVASARTDIDPTKILFESDGVRRDIAPSRSAGQTTAGTTGNGVKVGSHWDNPANPHPTLNQSHNIGGIGQSNQELFSQRGCGIISMAHGQGGAEIKTDNSAPTLTCNHEAPIVASCFTDTMGDTRGSGIQLTGDMANTLHCAKGISEQQIVCYGIRTANTSSNGWGVQENITHTLDTAQGIAVSHQMAVRRLTPVECERLQGFPDNHTLIPTEKRKQITAEEYAYLRHHFPNMTAEEAHRLAADGPRYKAIGNSMAVPVMRWIGNRILSAIHAASVAIPATE